MDTTGWNNTIVTEEQSKENFDLAIDMLLTVMKAERSQMDLYPYFDHVMKLYCDIWNIKGISNTDINIVKMAINQNKEFMDHLIELAGTLTYDEVIKLDEPIDVYEDDVPRIDSIENAADYQQSAFEWDLMRPYAEKLLRIQHLLIEERDARVAMKELEDASDE